MAARDTSKRNILSVQHAPADSARSSFWCVLRAGHGGPVPGDSFARDTYPGHEFFLCLRGRAQVRTQGRTIQVHAGEALWVNCYHPHRYTADALEPWEYYWLRAEGTGLDTVWQQFLDAGGPTVSGCDGREKRAIFERVFALMRDKPPALDALLHAELARLVALLLHALHSTGRPPEDGSRLPEPLRNALERMRLYFHQTLRLTELAELAGMSVSHFTREFRSALGTSPIDWLRRERITQARRRLMESSDSVKEIARQCGYTNEFYFSRDFKRMTGSSPSLWRTRQKPEGV